MDIAGENKYIIVHSNSSLSFIRPGIVGEKVKRFRNDYFIITNSVDYYVGRTLLCFTFCTIEEYNELSDKQINDAYAIAVLLEYNDG
jgi:hypothetical protein